MAAEYTKRQKIFESIGTSGTSGTLNGPIIDLTNLESVVGYGHFSVSNATMGLKFQEGTASGSVSDTTGIVRGGFKTVFLEVFRPVKRFGRFVLTGATTTGSYKSLFTVGFGARNVPTTQEASTTGLVVYSPAGGAASA